MVTDLFMNQSTRERKALSSTGGHGHVHIDIIARRSSPKGQTKLFPVKFLTLGGWGLLRDFKRAERDLKHTS